jgi:hypothetical protein
VRARTWLRRLLPGAIAAAVSIGVVAGLLAYWKSVARAEAVAVLRAAFNPGGRIDAAKFALETDPELGLAYAVRAVGEAQLGQLDRARDDVARADSGVESERARAWIAFREGRVDEGLDFARAHGDADEIDLLESAVGLGSGRRFAWAFRSSLKRWQDAGWGRTDGGELEALAWRILHARSYTLDLRDDAASRMLDLDPGAPPLDLALVEQARRDQARIRRDDARASGPPLVATRARSSIDDRLDAFVVRHELERAELELERDRLFWSEDDRARAIERMRRVLVVDPKNARASSLLLRALAREPSAHSEEIRSLARGVGIVSDDAARALWLALDLDGARAVVASVDPCERSRLLTFVAAAIEGRPLDTAARAFLRDRPWEARAFVEAHPDEDLAVSLLEARAQDDPLAALATCPWHPLNRTLVERVLATAVTKDAWGPADGGRLFKMLRVRGVQPVRAHDVVTAVRDTRFDLSYQGIWK